VSTSHSHGRKTRGDRLRERYSLRRLFNWRTFRSRITMLVVLAVGISVVLGALISYVSISNTVTHQLDNDLKQRAQIILDNSGLTNPSVLGAQSASDILIVAGVRATIVLANGQGIYPPAIQVGASQVQPNAPYGAPEIAVANGTSYYSLRTVDADGGVYRVYTMRDPLISGAAVAVAVSMAETESTLNTLFWVSMVVGLIGIALAGAAGFAIGRAALRPVEELSRATEYIARTGDLRSLNVVGDDELAQLTRNFNTMLEALARSQEHQKRLVADAGHELRTPLTSMRTNLDLLSQVMAMPDDDRLSPEDRVDLMNDVRAQMEELSILISDLVELSRDEQPSHAIEHLDLRDVVDRAAERVQRRAPTLTYDLQLSPWYLDGDPAALERLITNLMDNAAKWSPAGGTVTVTLADGLLQVADQGPGIAEEDLTHVFERFYRSPEARATPGSGLGLAIVRQIAENHGGRVAAARAQGGGALLGVWLPGTSVIGELPAAVR
jgi:two-component system sensor histidine kinase MprB